MPTYDACIVEAELRARAAYAEPGRHYHNEDHLNDCLDQLEAITGLEEAEQRLLRWAILWHDTIYDPRRTDNEERSAELARRELLTCGVSKREAEEVARLVLLTKHHRVEENDRLGALLVSIDLSMLGSEAERYNSYAAQVRQEYAHLPNPAWRGGRAKVLSSLLERDPLYPDSAYRARLEAQARSNMEAELERLAANDLPRMPLS